MKRDQNVVIILKIILILEAGEVEKIGGNGLEMSLKVAASVLYQMLQS